MRGLENYEPVEDRIRRFWADHEQGRILTDLIHRDERQYIFRAEVFTDREDVRPAAVGYAEEVIGSSPVNKTNALENAETSAIGRALANLNYAPKAARPSREEMAKAQRGQPPTQRGPVEQAAHELAKAKLRKACTDNQWDMRIVADLFAAQHKSELTDCTDPAVIEKFRERLFSLSDTDLRPKAATP